MQPYSVVSFGILEDILASMPKSMAKLNSFPCTIVLVIMRASLDNKINNDNYNNAAAAVGVNAETRKDFTTQLGRQSVT